MDKPLIVLYQQMEQRSHDFSNLLAKILQKSQGKIDTLTKFSFRWNMILHNLQWMKANDGMD